MTLNSLSKVGIYNIQLKDNANDVDNQRVETKKNYWTTDQQENIMSHYKTDDINDSNLNDKIIEKNQLLMQNNVQKTNNKFLFFKNFWKQYFWKFFFFSFKKDWTITSIQVYKNYNFN